MRPPKPESKTPMVGLSGVSCRSPIQLLVAGRSCWLVSGVTYPVAVLGSGFGWGRGFGGGVGGGVGAQEVGVAGEGVVGLAVDEEAD